MSQEVSKYEKQYRGKELSGFVSYKTFETIVQQYIEQLVDPALVMLQKVEGEEPSRVPFKSLSPPPSRGLSASEAKIGRELANSLQIFFAHFEGRMRMPMSFVQFYVTLHAAMGGIVRC